MIHMPRRSVTRFFIPLIDVLLLLFCIFLLMPIAREGNLEEERDKTYEQTEAVESLQRELERRTRELRKFEDLRAELTEVEKLKDEVTRLKAISKLSIQQRTLFQIIDIDSKTGEISHYDASNTEQPRLKIQDERTAKLLIERHLTVALGRELYYYFLYPRQESGYPTLAQERRYRQWFSNVANSLQEVRP